MKKREEKEALVNIKNEQRKKTPIIFNNDSYKRQNSPQFTKTFNNVLYVFVKLDNEILRLIFGKNHHIKKVAH